MVRRRYIRRKPLKISFKTTKKLYRNVFHKDRYPRGTVLRKTYLSGR
jgi:hypothetical protein